MTLRTWLATNSVDNKCQPKYNAYYIWKNIVPSFQVQSWWSKNAFNYIGQQIYCESVGKYLKHFKYNYIYDLVVNNWIITWILINVLISYQLYIIWFANFWSKKLVYLALLFVKYWTSWIYPRSTLSKMNWNLSLVIVFCKTQKQSCIIF